MQFAWFMVMSNEFSVPGHTTVPLLNHVTPAAVSCHIDSYRQYSNTQPFEDNDTTTVVHDSWRPHRHWRSKAIASRTRIQSFDIEASLSIVRINSATLPEAQAVSPSFHSKCSLKSLKHRAQIHRY
jgi:hypothetical protein